MWRWFDRRSATRWFGGMADRGWKPTVTFGGRSATKDKNQKVARRLKRFQAALVLLTGIYSDFGECDLTVWKPISRGLGGSDIICRRTSVMDLIWSSWKSTVSASLAIC